MFLDFDSGNQGNCLPGPVCVRVAEAHANIDGSNATGFFVICLTSTVQISAALFTSATLRRYVYRPSKCDNPIWKGRNTFYTKWHQYYSAVPYLPMSAVRLARSANMTSPGCAFALPGIVFPCDRNGSLILINPAILYLRSITVNLKVLAIKKLPSGMHYRAWTPHTLIRPRR